MRHLIAALVAAVGLSSSGCPSMKHGDPDQQAAPAGAAQLAARLATVDVGALATGLASDPQVEAVWADHGDPAPYVTIVGDRGRPLPVRFAAALILRCKGQRADPVATAEAFAGALQRDLAGWAYPWGRLWEGGDQLGTLGTMVVELGRPAVPALTALLDDSTPRDAYLGSEEATELAMRGYRVKDFAAFYLARITGASFPWERDLGRRDAAIAALRAGL